MAGKSPLTTFEFDGSLSWVECGTMAADWYDNPAWDSETQADFRRRLSRSRHQKFYYLGRKVSAVASHDPDAALDLCTERFQLAEDADERHGALAQKALILAAAGRHDEMFTVMKEAIGEDVVYRAVMAGEYCCLVAYFDRTDQYEEAIGILDTIDAAAQREVGRPFRSFPAYSARALLDYKCGRQVEAKAAAREALTLALEQSARGAFLSGIGPAPGFPNALHDKLLVIAGLWDEATLGPPPAG
jgi:tetratricopeptide (TPR) repeat protein